MAEQLLHLVFGGEVKDPQGVEFVNTQSLDVIGIFPSYQEALDAWRGASQRHVDRATTKYFIVHLHRFLQPDP